MSERELTTVYTAKTTIEAQLAKGLLESEGIRATVPGDSLNDEFGVATRMSGVTATTVMVAQGDAERALELLGLWREAAESQQD